MKDINEYIIEKLHLYKDIKVVSQNEDYWLGEADDVDKFPDEFYNNRKSTRKENGVQKNKPWYAVYICLKSLDGEASKDKIRELVWPGKTGQQSELFQGLREYGVTKSITSGEKRGYQSINDYDKWVIPQWPSNKIF